MANDQSCNPSLDFNILGSGPIFLGDTVRISANLGAGEIKGGSYMELHAFGYALNCHVGENFANCESEGNKVQFIGNLSTNCKTFENKPVQLEFPESNVIPITVVENTPPIRVAANTTCNVQFDVRIVELAENGDDIIDQAIGWPIPNEPAAQCDNGLTTAGSSTMAFQIADCSISVRKQVSADGTNFVDADTALAAQLLNVGATAYYRLAITNNGTAPYDSVEKIKINDAKLGIVNATVPPIAPGSTAYITGTEVPKLTQPQLCSGGELIENTAFVGAMCRTGENAVSASASDKAFVQCVVPPPDGLTLDKTASPSTYSYDGEVITYSYKLTNSGLSTLFSPFKVTDDKVAVTCPPTPTSLAPTESITCSATYKIDANTDIPGSIKNTAFATAQSRERSEIKSNTDSETIYYRGIQITKQIWDTVSKTFIDANSAGSAPVEYWDSGAIYKLIVKNIGNVALENVKVSDGLLGLTNVQVGDGKLDVGESVPLTSTSTGFGKLDQSKTDLCTKTEDVKNTASVSGTVVTLGGSVSDSDDAWLSCVGQPSIRVKKEVSIDNGATFYDVKPGTPITQGDGAEYKITVTNGDKVALINVVLTDNKVGQINIGELAKGAVKVYDKNNWPALDRNNADICAGSPVANNQASVEGYSKDVPTEKVTWQDSAAVDCIGGPQIKLTKEVSTDNGANWFDANSDDPIPYPTAIYSELVDAQALYRITVENPGPVQLTNVVLKDTKLGIDILVNGDGILDVNEKVVLTQILEGQVNLLVDPDVCDNIGTVTNTAKVTGKSAANEPVSLEDWATVNCVGQPAIKVLKEVSADGGQTWDPFSVSNTAPSSAWYRITVTNTGTTPLENVKLTDPMLWAGTVDVIGQTGTGKLAVKETVVLTHDGAGGSQNIGQLLTAPGLCAEDKTYVNTVFVNADDPDSSKTAKDQDTADFVCSTIEYPMICDNGKPNELWIVYNADDEQDFNKDMGSLVIENKIVPYEPLDPVRVKVTGKITSSNYVILNQSGVMMGDILIIKNTIKNPFKIPNEITVEIWDDNAEPNPVKLQTISFHGSCSEPLDSGDKLGGIMLLKGVWY